jgi:DNA polymerase III subunit delta
MDLEFREAWRNIQHHPIDSVYLLYGTDAFLMHKLVSAIRERVVPIEDAEFLFSKYDYEETPIQTVLLEAETAPFLGERRMIVIDRFSAVTAQKQTVAKGVEHDLTALEQYLEHPAPYTVLVLMVHTDKLDERKKLVKRLKAQAKVCVCMPMKPEECKAWISERFQEQSISIDPDAVELFLQLVGTDLQLLEMEMEKLALYTGKNGRVTVRTVNELVVKTPEQNVFSFVDFVVRQRMEFAIESYHELLLQKESPIYLLFLIARQFRLVLQTKLQLERGYSHQQIASQLGVHPYAVKIAAEQGRIYTRSQLADVLSVLGELDYRIKSGQESDKLGVERFLLTLPLLFKKEKSGL